MAWILKGLFVLAKSRRGRRLLFTATLAVIDLAQREEVRKLYAKARGSARR